MACGLVTPGWLVVVVKALQGLLPRTPSHRIVCKFVPQVLCGCLELEARVLLMQAHELEAIRHDPLWQCPLQNLLVG